MTIQLYNTLARAKAPFRPLDAKNVRIYVCGQTVYDYAHVGNARMVVVFDVLFRLPTTSGSGHDAQNHSARKFPNDPVTFPCAWYKNPSGYFDSNCAF